VEKGMNITTRQAIKELLESDSEKINKILISNNAHGDIVRDMVNLCRRKRVLYQFVPTRKIDNIAKKNQGVIAIVTSKEYSSLDEILDKSKKIQNPVLCVLDEITDPHNLGAILRNADCFGIIGIILPKMKSVGITETVIETSSGAIEHIPVTRVTNIAQTIDLLKKEGFWVIGADSNSGETCWKFDFKRPTAIVLGNEGYGLRRLVKEKCDALVRIPMSGRMSSLNVSSASAILFYEISRQKYQENSSSS